MKKVLSYLLIGMYATIMIQPVMPSVADGFEHLLNYQSHVSTVHHTHGKEHVHVEYIAAAKKSQGKSSSDKSGCRSEPVSEHNSTLAFEYFIIPIPYVQSYFVPLTCNISTITLLPGLRPPLLQLHSICFTY
ncbi:hypothetical protein BH11BAC3_BH11BAC3_48020 [soil metagenome]